jgi:hypothetical protein
LLTNGVLRHIINATINELTATSLNFKTGIIIMGWTYGSDWTSKQEIVDHCIDWGDKFTKLDHAVRGNHLWVLIQYGEGDRKGDVFVALYLLQKDGREWGYKDMDDTCGPYYYDCPLSYIKRTIESGRTPRQTTLEWHEKVKLHHATKAVKRQKTSLLKEGLKIKYQEVIYKLMDKYPGRKGWKVMSLEDNSIYRMTAKQTSESEIITA